MSKKCVVCGSFLPDDEKECFYCGYLFEDEIEEEMVEETVQDADNSDEIIASEETAEKMIIKKPRKSIFEYLLIFIGACFILFWVFYFVRIFFESYQSFR